MGSCISLQISCDAMSIFSSCQDPICRKASYISKLEDNLKSLKIALEKLLEEKRDLENRVNAAEQKPQMRRLHKVDGWLKRVETEETEVGKLIRSESQELEKLCLGGFCSKNCKSSYEFGKKVVEKLQVVASLRDEGNFNDVVEKVPDDPVDKVPEDLVIKEVPEDPLEKAPEDPDDGRPNKPTAARPQSTFDKVWKCLEEEKGEIIGLYGMGGVGKTTLLKRINNKLHERPNGYTVMLVDVSKDLQYEKIQNMIGKKIHLYDESWKDKSLGEKAQDIYNVLRKKKFVLLLDDIWEWVDLTKIGVPIPDRKIVSKVVFTTRYYEVCSGMEPTNPPFKVECLGHIEAWTLFQSKVTRETLDSHPEIPELARLVVKECAGLPLALIVVGRALRGKKTPQQWRHAISVLKRSAVEFPRMEEEVLSRLKLSFDYLPSDKLKSCLLYCGLFSEDYKILKQDLIDCWIGEGFLVEKSGAQDEGHNIIYALRDACLLEEDNDDDCVKMHDVIRDMALWIAKEIEKKEGYFVYASTSLTEAPEIEEWKGAKRMSLMENQIEVLSTAPSCPNLLTLFLNGNHLKTISNNFFQFMPSLKVLNLSGNRFLTKLPLEISNLVSLQQLDLSRTAIEEFPRELEALLQLKCLNLEHTSQLQVIPRDLISKFSKLQVLRMLNSGSLSEAAEDSVLFNNGERLIDELLRLKSLIMMSITLKCLPALQKFLRSHVLQSCTQSLCLQFLRQPKLLEVSVAGLTYLETLHILDCKYLEELKIGCPGEVQEIPGPQRFNRLQVVKISSCSKLRDLTWLILAPELKRLVVSDCLSMEEIISDAELCEFPGSIRNSIPFVKLKFFELERLRNLQSIYWNALPFQQLKEIKVRECPKLKKLPLDSNSANECKIVIMGQRQWWEGLQWEDEAARSAFRPCYKAMW